VIRAANVRPGVLPVFTWMADLWRTWRLVASWWPGGVHRGLGEPVRVGVPTWLLPVAEAAREWILTRVGEGLGVGRAGKSWPPAVGALPVMCRSGSLGSLSHSWTSSGMLVPFGLSSRATSPGTRASPPPMGRYITPQRHRLACSCAGTPLAAGARGEGLEVSGRLSRAPSWQGKPRLSAGEGAVAASRNDRPARRARPHSPQWNTSGTTDRLRHESIRNSAGAGELGARHASGRRIAKESP
jgi:hypothetical protein